MLNLFLISLLVALGRFTVPGHGLTGWPGLYEALAHMWVGALITLIVTNRYRNDASWLLAFLAVLEVFAFIGGHHG